MFVSRYKDFLNSGLMLSLDKSLAVLFGVISARILYPSEFGLYASYLATATVAISILKFGFTEVVLKSVIQKNRKERNGALASISVLVGFFGIVGLTITHLFLSLPNTLMVLIIMQAFLEININGLRKQISAPRYQFIGSVLINLSTLCTLLILNYSSYYISAQLIIMIRAISVIIALLYTVSLLEFKIDHLRFTGFRELLFDGSGYFSASVMHTILLTLDIFLIQKFSGNEWLASYKIALEYSHLIFMPYLIVTYVYVPKLSTSLTTSKDIKGIQLILNEVSRVLFVSSVIIAVILFFCSSKALVLLFGTEYANSVSIVKLLLPVLVLITIFGDPLNTLYLLNDKKSVYGAQITALLFMIILAIIITGFFDNFYLIYVGALGILIQRFIMFRKLKKNHDLCSLISF